jgi:hypothetical protein
MFVKIILLDELRCVLEFRHRYSAWQYSPIKTGQANTPKLKLAVCAIAACPNSY